MIMALSADELKKQKTPALETLMVIIEEILESRSDKSAEIAVGDTVSFEIRKNCVIEGEVLAKTDKRVKVNTHKISGVYQIASKKVDILASKPADDTEEEWYYEIIYWPLPTIPKYSLWRVRRYGRRQYHYVVFTLSWK